MEPAERFTQKFFKLIAAVFIFIVAFAIGDAFGGVKGFAGLLVFAMAAIVGGLGWELLKSVRH